MSLFVAALALGAVIGLGPVYGYLRTLIAVAGGAAILIVGVRYTRFVIDAPADPELKDVSEQGLRYVCSMCGLELKIEKASKERAPTHCMEPMVLIGEEGKPPLRSV